MDQRDDLAFVATVDPEVVTIHGDHAVPRIQLAHPDEAEVGQIRRAVVISLRETCQLRQMVLDLERDGDQSIRDHPQNDRDVLEMKRRLGQDRFACQQRLVNLPRNANGPS